MTTYPSRLGNPDAWLIREGTGTGGVAETARTVAEVLARWEIPHLIVGGLAVQEHGFPRTTIDLDVVVPDVLEADEFLRADVTGPFVRSPGPRHRLLDRRTGVEVDLLPGGQVLRAGCQVPFPLPTRVCDQPVLVSLPELISLKLDSWQGTPLRRMKDKADVVELILARTLPRDFPVHPSVDRLYRELWDGLQAEGAVPPAC